MTEEEVRITALDFACHTRGDLPTSDIMETARVFEQYLRGEYKTLAETEQGETPAS